ncbi:MULTISPECIES: hypothetical protein [unclassified Bradyrhizobium]|uniref:hypothetical protein n=1 Tax=Bradyrhizobium TaxID=374 RepID=UPI0028E1F8BF|nr:MULTISPECIES: hypothetical protein [unclassified Bradyrhizobium]
MTADNPDDLTEDERAYLAAADAAAGLAEHCKKLRERGAFVDRDPLSQIINFLMTELWDRSFSQSEIRVAFNAAVKDMNRYAAGQERR